MCKNMNSKIEKLDINVIDKIISGEIIESPSTVVKELIENSIDANSKNILIYLEDYGRKSIKVIDDGIGMSKKDAKICFYRYTTSKIKHYNDLENINTLGFKGEALASISSISKCKIFTKDENSLTGISFVINNNIIQNIEEVCLNRGTIIIVEDLFYNLTTKKKYLKNKNLELLDMISYINNLFLSHNNISISLYNNNKKIISYHANTLFESIVAVFGPKISKNMIKLISNTNNKCINIDGYISTPECTRTNMDNIIVIINQRPIFLTWIKQCIKEAYSTYILKHQYPFIVLKLKVPKNFIDINITPKKDKIKFENDN